MAYKKGEIYLRDDYPALTGMNLSLEERKKVKKQYSDLIVANIELARRAVTWFTPRDFEKYSNTGP